MAPRLRARPVPAVEPAEFFELAAARPAATVRRYDLGRTEDRAQWRVTANAGSPGLDREGVTFRAPRPGGRLEAGFEVAAADVDEIEVDVSGLKGAGFVEVTWLGESAAGPARGSQVVTARDLAAAESAAARFLVRSDPSWHGRIRGLELRVANPAAEATRVRSVTLLRLAGSRDALAADLGRPYRLEVDHEVRSGFLLADTGELELLDGVSGPGRLRFGLALLAPARGRVQAELRLRDAAGRATGSEALGALAAPAEPGHWEDHVVRVPALPAGTTAALVLQSRIESSAPPAGVVGGIRFEPDPPPGDVAPPDVVVISIDTLRADRLSLYGCARATSPHLDAWARQADGVFDDAVAPAPSTLPSHASLFTGREVLRHGAFLDVPLGPGFATLAELFRDGGYETVAVTGGGYLHPFYGLHRGFDRYRFWPRRPDRNDLDLGDGVRRALELLGEGERGPRLVFLHTYDVHAPYRAHQPWLSEWRAGTDIVSAQPLEVHGSGTLPEIRVERRPVLQTADGAGRPMRAEEAALVGDLYDSGVAAMDEALAPLLDFVSSPERRRRTLVVFLSDHGESLGEQGRWEHGYLDQTNLHVPLVLQLPNGDGRGRRLQEVVSLVDVLPTLAEACGIAVPAGVDGVTLISRLAERAVHPARAVVSYSGEINEGLAVRAGALKWVLPDSFFEPGARAVVFDLARDRAELSPAPPGGVEPAASLDRLGRKRLMESRPGTFLALENREPGPVSVVLRSAALRWNSVKWAAGERPVATLRSDGSVAFTLAPGGTTRLLVQDRNARGALTVSLETAAGMAEEVSVPAAEGRRSATAAPGSPQTAERRIARSGRVAVTLQVRDLALAAAGAPELPGDTERQLKALGYLD